MPAPDRSLRRRAVAHLLLSDVYWALSFPLLKALTALNHRLLPAAGAWFGTAAALAPRYLLAGAAVLAWSRGGARPRRRELAQGLALAAFSAAGILLQTDGLQYTAASTSSFLTQLTAILIPAWLAVRHRHVPGAVVWLAAALVLAGAAILGHLDWRALRLGRGETETLGCALFFTGQILCLNHPGYAGNRPAPVTLVMLAGQALVFAVLAAATAPGPGAFGPLLGSPPWLGFTFVLTTVCTLAATVAMNRWQPLVTAIQAGLIYALEPAVAATFALFLPALFSRWAGIGYPNERATWAMLTGGGLIMLANVLVQVRPPAAAGAAGAAAPPGG